MKIKTLFNLAIAILALSFVACDDDQNYVGSDMKPGGDDIETGTDTVYLTAKTFSLKDSVYATTDKGMLGEYDDPIFGRVKSDFLAEFYCPDDLQFKDRYIGIDSVFFNTIFYNVQKGDTVSPTGISIYALNKPLKKDFYTNIDPTEYYNPADLLGQTIYSIKGLPTIVDPDNSSNRYKIIPTKVSNDLGVKFRDEWVRSKGATFRDSESFKEFFPGIYCTSEFGVKTMINTQTTFLNIHYKYWGLKVDGVTDSIHTHIFQFSVTPEVIQINHVKNNAAAINKLIKPDANKTYIKSPAGVYTEITIPLADIVRIAGRGKAINSATFRIKGYSELESQSDMDRPDDLLFVNKDSLHNYFTTNRGVTELNNFRTAFIMTRQKDQGSKNNNTYAFTSLYGNSSTGKVQTNDNIGTLINYYASHYKDAATVPDLKYLIIPITRTFDPKATGSGTTLMYTLSVYNQMKPTAAIFRTDKENMKMKFIYSKFGDK